MKVKTSYMKKARKGYIGAQKGNNQLAAVAKCCEYCDTLFCPTHRSRICCSDYCLKARRAAIVRSNAKISLCACGEEGIKKYRRRYCSESCKQEFIDKTYLVTTPNGQVFDSRKRGERPKPEAINCVVCGKLWYWDTSRGRSQKPKACKACASIIGSRAAVVVNIRRAVCRIAHPRLCAAESCDTWFDAAPGMMRRKPALYCSVKCRGIGLRKDPDRVQVDRHAARRLRYTEFWQTHCRRCSSRCSASMKSPGGPRYCGDRCRNDAYRDARRNVGNHRRRAKKYGCEYHPGISTKKVAERDNYRCQLCHGKVVPSKRNGEYNPMSWSIGHIVAMSKGGAHSWDNVQCECIGCNVKKGTKTIGQLSMPWAV